MQRRASREATEEAPGIVHEVLRSPGDPLDPAARSFMEARFGHDFGRVRVHADARAAQSAAAVGAHAYTVGSHVVFATGRYAPQSAAGRHLLAHELTHVVQQTGARPVLQRQVGGEVLEEVERGGEEFRRGRRRDLSRIIGGMRFRKVIADCPEDTGVRLAEVLSRMRSRVAGNQACIRFFRENFGITPERLLSPDALPTLVVDPRLTISGQTRCPSPSTRIGVPICTSPLRERVIMHEFTHWAGCLTAASTPSSEELATRGEDICIGTVQEALDAARRAREADPASPERSTGRSTPVQPKLVVGRAGDPLEAEADRIADAVTRAPDSELRPWNLPRTAALAPLAVSRAPSPALIQRRVSYDVLDWDADRLGPPTPQNGSDPRLITVPPTGQVSISALVEVDGDASDRCEAHEVGTTQTAWMAWTVARYQGRNAGDGRITVRHRARVPMRDPSPAGGVWYDPSRVRSASTCGEAVGIFHRDSPWHGIPKARNNDAVTGSPLNYLRHYTRGLHLVAYLTARDAAGTFLPQPLRFVYWNSLQDFSFTPNFANPLQMWSYAGGVRVNIGGKGRGETADAPYFTTAGPNFNDHFNDSANWSIEEQP